MSHIDQAQYAVYQRYRTRPIGELNPISGIWMWRYVFEHCLGMAEALSWNRIPEFEPRILKAVNDGVDKDTAGAVAGALLGAYWGESHIPSKWRSRVSKGAEIVELANQMIWTV